MLISFDQSIAPGKASSLGTAFHSQLGMDITQVGANGAF